MQQEASMRSDVGCKVDDARRKEDDGHGPPRGWHRSERVKGKDAGTDDVDRAMCRRDGERVDRHDWQMQDHESSRGFGTWEATTAASVSSLRPWTALFAGQQLLHVRSSRRLSVEKILRCPGVGPILPATVVAIGEHGLCYW